MTYTTLNRKAALMLNEMYLQALTRHFAPMPWVLDQCNDKGVCVKDARGEDLYYEDFGGIPDEMGSGQREHIIGRAKLFAQWLVAFSSDRPDDAVDLPRAWPGSRNF